MIAGQDTGSRTAGGAPVISIDTEHLAPRPTGDGLLASTALPAGPMIDLAAVARSLGDELYARLVALARTPQLLVATDYDGTIAHLVDRPTRAFPLDANVDAMRALAALPSTDSAVDRKSVV